MYIALAICAIIISTAVYRTSKDIKKIKEQKEEIKKYKNITEYIIANKDKIILSNIKRDLAWFKLGNLEMEIYLGSETFVKINGIDFGHNTELAKVLKNIYYKDREKLLF